MNRRCFLQFVTALAFWRPNSKKPTPLITKYEDGYVIEVGCLRCSSEESRSGSPLVFGVFITSNPEPGVVEETRMIPTETLKSNLGRVGFPVVWELWHPDYPFLVAYLDNSPGPHDIAVRLQRVLSGNDSRLFWNEPNRKSKRVDVDPGEFKVR